LVWFGLVGVLEGGEIIWHMATIANAINLLRQSMGAEARLPKVC
jgi:hypothetical protein